MSQDYYDMLGVQREASAQDIKKAFRQVARECHPDVAGEDPAAAERFKDARKAYETLIDPVTRARYDRRGQRRGPRGGSFFDAFYKHMSDAEGDKSTDRSAPRDSGGARGAGRRAAGSRANNLDLDDLFNDFGDFGFGNRRKTRGPQPGAEAGAPAPTPGNDVHIEIDVPAQTARDGGTITAVYYRMQRSDSWRPGSGDPGVVRVQDIADIRITPGLRDGEMLRERGLGDAGTHGGPYGSLVVRVRVIGRAPTPPPPVEEPAPAPPPREPEAQARAPHRGSFTEKPSESRGGSSEAELEDGDQILSITVVEALLGGRVEVDTPQGVVRVSLRPGTSGGQRLRLRGKGVDGEDLFLRTRIVVPRTLDDESRELIERFAELNPSDPRS